MSVLCIDVDRHQTTNDQQSDDNDNANDDSNWITEDEDEFAQRFQEDM